MLDRSWLTIAFAALVATAPVAAGATQVEVSVAQTGADVLVGNANFTFAPPALDVDEGATVVWEQNDAFPHTVTASDGSFDSHPGCNPDGSGTCMGAGETFSFTFSGAGTVAYYCKVHGTADGSGMAGTVTVNAAAVPSPAPPPTPTPAPSPDPDPTPTATADTTPPPPSLPETGVGALAWFVAGLATALGGAALLRPGRRRR